MRQALSKGGQLPTGHSLAYWAYHFGRSAFFMMQGIAGWCWCFTFMCLRPGARQALSVAHGRSGQTQGIAWGYTLCTCTSKQPCSAAHTL